jgi:threonylcarbamoyladenosine tRNA methylthiotransferase MtaB
VVFNTCAVTNEAVRQARQAIRKARRERPDARLIVTGCAAQIDPAAFAAMPEVDLVLGNAEKAAPGALLDTSTRVRVNDIMSIKETAGHLIAGLKDRARAYVEVQNGCDHRCTFCIIPYGRGNSRSAPAGEVVEQVRRLSAEGYNEVVLTGVDVTSWGTDLPGQPTLGQLVARILKLVPDLPRLRLSSIDAAEIDPDLFKLLETEPRLMPYLHLSLQAGDDLILKRMKRRHSRADALKLVSEVRRVRPDTAFGADLIAGFPTETEEAFANTLKLVEEAGLAFLHVFPYSARPGTPAARMPPVKGPVIKDRARRLREAGQAGLERHLQRQVGRTLSGLVEREGVARAEDFTEIAFDPALGGVASPGANRRLPGGRARRDAGHRGARRLGMIDRRVLAAVLAATLLLGVAARAQDLTPPPEPKTEDTPPAAFQPIGPIRPVELSVMTYNVEGLPWPVRAGRGSKLKAIGRHLAALREKGLEPDVVLLQEGFSDEVDDLIELSGYPYVAKGPRKKQRDGSQLTQEDRPRYKRVKYRRKGEGWGKWGSSGLWVLSNHPINWVKSHAYHYCAGLDCLANKGVMLVSLDVPGLPVPVEIADTHLNSKGASGVPRNRNRTAHHLQAAELGQFMADRPHARRAADRRRRLQRHARARPLRLCDAALSVRGGQPGLLPDPRQLRRQDLGRRRRAVAGHPGPDRLQAGRQGRDPADPGRGPVRRLGHRRAGAVRPRRL